jgi:hypothetical protein
MYGRGTFILRRGVGSRFEGGEV